MSAPIGPGEQWAAVEGTGGDYEVSTLGRIRRTRDMRWGQLPAWGLVQCSPNNHGYPMFNTTHRGKSINRALHLVVLRAFRGPPIPGFDGAHLSGNKLDARLENLAYVSKAANAHHKRAHGTDPRGARNPSAKLTDAQVREIRASTEPYPVLAQRYGLTRNYISDIRRGAAWKHLLTTEAA